MSDVEFSSEITVKLVRWMASDDMVVQAAQVSSKGENNPETVPRRLIESLMYGKHGSPFEHNAFTFFVEAPIFVFREWQRHRISSFNEMSGRYTVLPGKFYYPPYERRVMLVEGSSKMKPTFVEDNRQLVEKVRVELKLNSTEAWTSYQNLLAEGVAPEVARMVLPVNTYSQMYWTVNARSLMNFLSLRIHSADSTVPSYPQVEIQYGAELVEDEFANIMPLTWQTFVAGGRVAP